MLYIRIQLHALHTHVTHADVATAPARCSQCFRAFPDDVFYEFEGRRYCEHDFQVLFAPCCGKCSEYDGTTPGYITIHHITVLNGDPLYYSYQSVAPLISHDITPLTTTVHHHLHYHLHHSSIPPLITTTPSPPLPSLNTSPLSPSLPFNTPPHHSSSLRPTPPSLLTTSSLTHPQTASQPCPPADEFIIGRVIKAMNNNWHPACFTCDECHKELADLGFIRYMGRAVCHDCNASLKALSHNKYMCHKCQ